MFDYNALNHEFRDMFKCYAICCINHKFLVLWDPG